MNFSDANGHALSSQKNDGEVILNGRAVSRGKVFGEVVCLHGHKRQFYRIELKNFEIENELRRFHSALELAKLQIENLAAQNSKFDAINKTDIFKAHLLMIEDKFLIAKIESIVKEKKINVEWAVKIIIDDFLKDYKNIADEHLRERYIDLEDVAERLQNALGGGDQLVIPLAENSIIVAKDVKPSTLVEFSAGYPQAIVTERGGWTSHTFILARELSIPAVTGLDNVLRLTQTGDEIIVDGYRGEIILRPKKETIRKFKLETAPSLKKEPKKFAATKSKFTTLDWREITLRANADFPEGYIRAKRDGARGIGLYRSEFLFNRKKGFPTELEQIEAYRNIAESVGEDAVRIRTFDLTADQLINASIEKEQNPALGLRGIRLSLSNTEQFRVQFRAILQAAADCRIDIVLPMISDISEIVRAKAVLEDEKLNLKNRKIEFGNPRVGVMIEVPAAIFIINEVAEEADFFCLGTNDLVQYLLAVDRDNESVADWFRTLHPAVLRSIKKVVDAARASEIPVLICGEMAGSPVYAAVLIGLGATELSMNPNSVKRVGDIVSAIAFEEAAEIAEQLLKCKTSDAAEQLVSEFFTKKWSHLFSAESLPANKKNF